MAQEFEVILKLTHFEIRVWNEPSAHWPGPVKVITVKLKCNAKPHWY